MIETAKLSQRGETDWLTLRHHVEWTQGFALIFLFCSNASLQRLYRERLARIYQARVSTLEVLALDSPEKVLEQVMALVRSPSPLHVDAASPLWIDLSNDQNPQWAKARNATLARLNEHRELMRQRLGRPLILILPADYRPKLRELAPDLWSIRNFSLDLQSAEQTLIGLPPSVVVTKNEPRTMPDSRTLGTRNENALRILDKEWDRLKRRGAQDRATLRAGLAAADAALDDRQLTEAYRIARDTLELARELHSQSDSPETVRDLSISLNRVGHTALALGRLEEAEAAFRESLELRRLQRERLGDTPETLRDLSISLDNVGDTACSLGRLEEARKCYVESLNLWQRLHLALPDMPEYTAQTERLQRLLEELNQP